MCVMLAVSYTRKLSTRLRIFHIAYLTTELYNFYFPPFRYGAVFVPKFDVYDGEGAKKYRLRPDTCVGGLCVMCRCGGQKGKCCRIPYIVRNPETFEPVRGNSEQEDAQVTELFSGWKNVW